MHSVVSAEYVSGYRIRITFDNGVQKIVDFSSHLNGPIFVPLKNIQYFKRFKVNKDIDTIAWPNSADFCPELLYQIGKAVREKAIV